MTLQSSIMSSNNHIFIHLKLLGIITEEQIRMVFDDNLGIILDISPFLRRTDENYSSIIIKYPPYLFFWINISLHNKATYKPEKSS